MKNLMVWGVLICLSAGAFAQEPAEAKRSDGVSYAVNTATNSNISAIQNTNIQVNTNTSVQTDDDALRVKTITKTFPANRSDRVVLSNQYGATQIKTWDKKEVKIDVTVRAYSNNDKEAQNLIDQVNIDADKNGDVISCKTSIGSSNRSGRNRRREVRVNYVVFLPASNALNVTQQFGNVDIGDFSAPLNANVQYGDFNAGNLSDASNYISVQYGKTNIEVLNKATIKQQYGSGVTIGIAGAIDLDAQYAGVNISTVKGDATIKQQYGSGLKLGSVNNLILNVQYANVNLGTVKGSAIIKQQYNSITIGSAGKINLNSEYAGVNIGTLKSEGNFRMSYNNFTINEIASGCKTLVVDAEYVDVSLGFAGGYNGDFVLRKSYGGFKYGNNVRLTSGGGEDERRSSTKSYSGKIGNGGSGDVMLKTAYGSVSIK